MPKESETKKPAGYTAQNITVLEGLEPVRTRPGMYIGSTGATGLHHLIWEVVDNSLDEAMAGFCTEITVKLLPNGQISVRDNGRGIPIDIHKQYKVSALELVLTKLHAGGKFGGGGYKVSGGLHGVGVSVVNALSTWLKAEVYRDGGHYVQEYECGKPKFKVKEAGKTKEHGTSITFQPDPTIFKETLEFDWQTIIDHLRQQAYLTKGIKIIIVDERIKTTSQSYTFYFEGGIASYVRHMNRQQEQKHDNIFYVEKKLEDETTVEIAVRYVEDFKELIFAFANNIFNPEGGMHLMGFRSALTRTLNSYARGKGFLKEKDDNLTGEDVREGLTAVISVKLTNPQFEGQTKAKLGNPEIRTAVETVFGESFTIWLEEHPKDGEAIIGRCLLAARARVAAKLARDTVIRKGALEGFTLPGKLSDCSSRNASESELYIVEGDSAGGCFSADTKIALADGRNLNFIELEKEWNQGKTNYCYTIKDTGEIGVEKILHPRCTKKNTNVIKITLDNGEEITCTPDHKFMLRDGVYTEAQNLTKTMSLMPLYKKISEITGRITIAGYEMVLNPKTHKWIFTHLLADQYNIEHNAYTVGINEHKHHKDFNKTYLNNSLSFAKKIQEMGKNIFDVYEKERSNLTKRNTNIVKLETLINKFFEGNQNLLQEAVSNFNHKIVKIQKLTQKIDVYDIEVPNTHNFALASGIFVHNSAKQGRNREFQAILPLRGKIMNIERARLDKILTNTELKSLIIAFGTNIGEMFDITRLRYHRIIIMTDADVDGAHIRTLLLTFFFRHFPELIMQGHIYIAQPPLYRVQVGKEMQYAFSDEEKAEILANIAKRKEDKSALADKKKTEKDEEEIIEEKLGDEEATSAVIGGVKVNIQRYKGLGEMNPEQLWETTMDPATRTLKLITVEDAEKADQIFDILMGDEVEPRRRFIQTHAQNVTNLDI